MKAILSSITAIALWVSISAGTHSAHAAALQLSWTNHLLTISGPHLPGERVIIWYLEAFCRPGGHERDWSQTTIPHRTQLIEAAADGTRLRLRTTVEPGIVIDHQIRAFEDEVEFELTCVNRGIARVEAQWFQPCMRVERFTGLAQSNYTAKSFIFTKSGLTRLDRTRRTEEARYRGGQVYVPAGIQAVDVNPRPISPDVPVNGLIGCFSADEKKLLAMAWDRTHELFQGVIVCLHNDPHLGGLDAGEVKRLRGRVYLLENDPDLLLRRYAEDFSAGR